MDNEMYYDVTIDESIVTQSTGEKINPAVLEDITATLNELSAKVDNLNSLINITVNSEEGAHGLRYYNGQLQVKSGDTWVALPSVCG